MRAEHLSELKDYMDDILGQKNAEMETICVYTDIPWTEALKLELDRREYRGKQPIPIPFNAHNIVLESSQTKKQKEIAVECEKDKIRFGSKIVAFVKDFADRACDERFSDADVFLGLVGLMEYVTERCDEEMRQLRVVYGAHIIRGDIDPGRTSSFSIEKNFLRSQILGDISSARTKMLFDLHRLDKTKDYDPSILPSESETEREIMGRLLDREPSYTITSIFFEETVERGIEVFKKIMGWGKEKTETDMKEIEESVRSEEEPEESKIDISEIEDLLRKNEVSDRGIVDITVQVAEMMEDEPDSKDMRGALKRVLSREFKACKRNPKLIFFIGPTSAGKTTTLAKIASNRLLNEDKRVGLISSDTYRVGGTEQLEEYAEILDTPFEICSHEANSKELLKGFKGYDYILIDTIAYYKKEEYAWEEYFQSLYESCDGYDREIFLVLPANGKYLDLEAIVDTIAAKYEFSYVFTKLDESYSLGTIYNLYKHNRSPIRYLTYGPHVPDDIESFDPDRYAEALVRSDDPDFNKTMFWKGRRERDD